LSPDTWKKKNFAFETFSAAPDLFAKMEYPGRSEIARAGKPADERLSNGRLVDFAVVRGPYFERIP